MVKGFKIKGIVMFILIILLLQLTSCAKKETIKIGFSAGLSGRSSELGVSGRNGAKLAVEEINKAGGINGRKLDLIVKDDKDNSSTALTVDKELINEGVSVIIGHLVSGVMTDVIKLIDDKNILMISPTISTDLFSSKDDNFIRVIPSNKILTQTLSEYAYIRRSYKTAVIIYEKNNFAYTGDIYKNFKQSYEKLGGRIIYTSSFDSGNDAGIKVLAERIKSLDPDCVLISASAMDTAMMSQQLYKLGARTKLITGMWAMTDDLAKNGGAAVEGMFTAGTYDSESGKSEFVKFKEKYISEYGTLPTFASVYSYNAVMVFCKAAEKCSTITTTKVKNKIIEIHSFDGLQERFNINKYGDIDGKYMIFIINDGKFERVY